jgi:hypothetical protein
MLTAFDSGPIVAQTIAASHDWMEQTWGWAQVAGLILALVALVIALQASGDSKRSADAAEESGKAAVRLPKQAGERPRQPK